MGKRGPARRPTALRLVEGARPDKVNQNEPKPLPVSPEPPAEWTELESDVRAVWDYTLAQLEHMGVAFAADRDALVAYCEAVVLHRRASAELATGSITVVGAQGGRVRNPVVQVQRDAAAAIRAFAQEFGLTPSARASVKAEKGAEGDADNPFAPTAEG